MTHGSAAPSRPPPRLRVIAAPPRRRLSRRRRRLLTRALPLALVALAAFGLGVYESGAGERSQTALVGRYMTAWSAGDYAAMYALLDGPSKLAWSESAFREGYVRAARTATVGSLRVVSIGEPSGGALPVLLEVRTRLFGSVRATVQVPIGSDGSSIAFNPAMVFPGVRPGERLHRVVVLGARGAILADDGTPLAQGRQRTSPIPQIASQVVGALGPIPPSQAAQYAALGYPPHAQVGLSGLEQAFQSLLVGRIGGTLFAGQRVLASSAPRGGASVRSTIDPTIEQAALNAIGGRYAGMTVMNPRTGGILALAGIALDDLQPPGSTMKIITAAAALQAGITTINTVYPYATSADVSGFTIHNSNNEDCGGTLILAFAVSCNSVFAPLGAQLGAQRFVSAAEAFGFNRPAGIPGALESTLPSAATIGDQLAVASSAIGQGAVQATTLQMAEVGATIAMGGRRPIPTFLHGAHRRLVRVVPGWVAHLVQKMMVAVVQYGTGTAAQISGVQVAGKTGTAELANTANKKNAVKLTDAWFVGYAPVGRPRVVACALFPNSGFGALTAAPAVAEVLRAALQAKY